jgi:hypothetical protein
MRRPLEARNLRGRSTAQGGKHGTGDEQMSMETDKAKVTKSILDALMGLDREEKDGEKQLQIRAEAMVEYALQIYGLNRIFPKVEYIVTMSDILAAYERGDEFYEPQ